MTADRWAICPNCVKVSAAKERVLLEKIEQPYGPKIEYLQLCEEYELLKRELHRDLREEWELGFQGDVFKIWYYAQCMKCAFVKEFTHREEL